MRVKVSAPLGARTYGRVGERVLREAFDEGCGAAASIRLRIGRYHCQNDNGPIKILNRCNGQTFDVPYERRDKKKRAIREQGAHIRREEREFG